MVLMLPSESCPPTLYSVKLYSLAPFLVVNAETASPTRRPLTPPPSVAVPRIPSNIDQSMPTLWEAVLPSSTNLASM